MDWISIDDRLPQNHADVLMCTSAGQEIIVGWRGEDGQWATWNEPRGDISHWMPLPDLPAART